MTARFAGSRTLDERRRRWLATNEAERSPVLPVERPSPSSQEECVPKEANLRQFPVRKVISPKGWKIALVSLLAVFVGFAILLAGALGIPDPALMGPGWQRLIGSNGGSLLRQYEGGLLMLSGQLALLMWWGRSRSLRDFEGQYRIWLWAAFTVMAAGWSLIGQWHWAFSDAVCWRWSARFPQRELVCWMLPSALVAGTIWRKLCADMRECKSSLTLLWLAAFAFVAAMVFRLGIDRTTWPEATKQLTGASLGLLACVGVFASFLAHARFVFHISPEPPEVRPSLWSRLSEAVKVLVQKLPKPRLTLRLKLKRTPKPTDTKPVKKAPRSKKQTAEEPAQKSKADDRIAEPASKKPAPRKVSKPAEPVEPAVSKSEPKTEVLKPDSSSKAETKSEPAKPVAPEKEPPRTAPVKEAVTTPKTESPRQPVLKTTPPPQQPKKTLPEAAKPSEPPPKSDPKPPEPVLTEMEEDEDEADDRQYRVETPLDPSQLKGLSKKERRKLRKQHKESQRQRSQ